MMKLSRIVLIILAMLLLPGCWDKIELEDYAYVAAIGIDKGIGNTLVVTFDIANPQVGSTEKAKSEREPPSEIVTFSVPDITSARDLANASVTRRVTFAHATIIVVGEELARSELFFKTIEGTLRDREFRRDMNILISREKASEFLKNNKPKLETRPHKYFEFMAERWREIAVSPPSDIHDFMQRSEEGEGLFLVIYGTTKEQGTKYGEEDKYIPGQINMTGGDPAQIIGSAVVKSGKMIGTLNGEETRLSLLLRPQFKLKNAFVTFPDPLNSQYNISAKLFKEKNTDIKYKLGGKRPKVEVTVPLSVEVSGIPSFIDYVEDKAKQDLLEKSMEVRLSKDFNKLVEKTQKEFQGDPFIWGTDVRRMFWTYEDYKNFDWAKKYPGMDVNVQVKVHLRNFGKQLKPPSQETMQG